MGGAQINAKAEVISMNTQKPIPGLYACGEITGGVQGGGRLGTMSMSDCMVFGMIAGENVQLRRGGASSPLCDQV